VNTIHELLAQGKSIRHIAATLELSRNTVRKYLHGTAAPQATPRARRKRGSKLDAFKHQIDQWIKEDHLYNCATMLPRLRSMGYTGSGTLLREFVHDLRPPTQGHHPVRRYETDPGEQLQFDWAEFRYEQEGVRKKLYGFTAVLSYSRMRYVTFVKRCDAATLIRCLMEAFEYMGGLPKAALTDRMKTVLLDMDGKMPIWHPRFADAHGVHRRLTTGLQILHAPDQREGGAQCRGDQIQLLARRPLYRPERLESASHPVV
jgi:transposase